ELAAQNFYGPLIKTISLPCHKQAVIFLYNKCVDGLRAVCDHDTTVNKVSIRKARGCHTDAEDAVRFSLCGIIHIINTFVIKVLRCPEGRGCPRWGFGKNEPLLFPVLQVCRHINRKVRPPFAGCPYGKIRTVYQYHSGIGKISRYHGGPLSKRYRRNDDLQQH